MTLDEIKKEYTDAKKKYKKMYREEMINIITKMGLYDVDVIDKKTNKKGRISLQNSTYNHDIEPEIRFVPYKKDGTLSKNSHYVFIWPDAIEKLLPKHFEKAE